MSKYCAQKGLITNILVWVKATVNAVFIRVLRTCSRDFTVICIHDITTSQLTAWLPVCFTRDSIPAAMIEGNVCLFPCSSEID